MEQKEILLSRFLSSSLIFVTTHLDVKGHLRGEVSEGAGNHDSGALVTKNTHQTFKYTQDSQSQT